MKKNLTLIRSLILACLVVLLMPSLGLSKTIRVAVLPWKVNSAESMDFIKSAMADMLSSRIGSGPSVELLRSDLVKGAIGDKAADLTDEAASLAGRKLNADYVLYGSLTVIGNSISLDAKLLSTADGVVTPFYSKATGLDAIVGLADKLSADVLSAAAKAAGAVSMETASDKAAKAEPPAAEAKSVAAEKPEQKEATEEAFIIKPKEGELKPVMWRSRAFEGMAIAIAASDLDKDGVKELFILGKRSVTIARVKSGALEVIKEIKGDGGVDFIAITAFDADSDGSPEIYISGIRDNRPSGSVVEFKDNDYKVTVTGVKWLMRTMQAGKQPPALIGEDFRKGDGFYGGLRLLKKQGAAIVDKGPFEITLPRGVDIYRFEAFDLTGSGDIDVVTLDGRDFLRIYRKGKGGEWVRDWKSADFYGGTLNNIESGEDRPASAEAEPIAIEGRFFHADLNRDGKDELIIKRNIPGGLGRYAGTVRSFTTGSIMGLSWDRDAGNLTENWKTKDVKGYIADFFIDGVDKDGAKEITMLVVEGTDSLTGTVKSYILSYRLSI